MKISPLFIFILLLTIGCTKTQKEDTSQTFVQRINLQTAQNVQCGSGYYFEYPADKNSGYYNVDCQWMPQDQLQHCNECMGSASSCGVFLGQAGLAVYKMYPGYTENFSIYTKYPVYGAWDIRNFTDYRNKCFVGDCNKGDERHVLCINNDYTIDVQSFACKKWVYAGDNQPSTYCINKTMYVLYKDKLDKSGVCREFKKINFYYVYNEWSGYEGYDSTWKTRWQNNLNQVNGVLAKYGIHLYPVFYEVKLTDNSNLPAALISGIVKGNTAFHDDANIQFSILAGKKPPYEYGLNCSWATGINPCSTAGSAIPDYNDYMGAGNGFYTLLHESGHQMGCTHSGELGSLSGTMYSQDVMGYGGNAGDFLYECRITLWLLGINQNG
jgi:hypothetical protein